MLSQGKYHQSYRQLGQTWRPWCLSKKKSLLNKERRTTMDAETQYCFRAGGGAWAAGRKGPHSSTQERRREGPRPR